MSLPTIGKGLPFDAGSGGLFPQIMAAPHRLIFDSTIVAPDGIKIGNIYKAFASLVTVANLFQGPVEIYIRNSSVPSPGTYTMPASWYLSTDSNGCSFLSGTYFTTSPLAIIPDCQATLTFAEAAGGSTFTLTNPQMNITGATLVLGPNGTLINGATNGNLFLRTTQVTSSGQTLMTGVSNTVTAFDSTVIQNNMLPGSMTLNYDSTSHVNTQNGNSGTPLFTGMVGPAGPAGPAGSQGPAGPAGTGGASYLPATAPANGSTYVLSVSSGGVETWQPQSGYNMNFSTGQGAVEIGTTLTTIPWAATFNFTPTSVVVTCTNPGGTAPANQTPAGSTSLSGSFSATFLETVPGTQVTINISCLDPSSAPHTATLYVTWAAKIIWASVTPPLTAGQSLWNTLNAGSSALDLSGGHHSPLSFTSLSGQDQVFARLSTYGTPTLFDSGNDAYPAQLVGTVAITENGVAGVSYSFFTVGAPSLTFSWSL